MGQTQFRSDDTVKWWLGFGDGSDGDYSSTGNATDAPIDSSCSGSATSTSLSATNASFAAGKPVLIHQTRGTGAGNWELNQIDSYTAGTITLKKALQNTYTDSGASQAQVIQLKQYNNFTQNSGHTLTAKAWDGNVGGILAFFAKGTVTVTGNISTNTRGYLGASTRGVTSGNHTGYQGEGTGGTRNTISRNANGNAGGGGVEPSNNGGGGGANGANGTNGQNSPNGGLAGAAAGHAQLTTMVFGGGGGSGAGGNNNGTGGAGGTGGGITLIIAANITITGTITHNAGNGVNGSTNVGGGGGGAGGSCLIKCVNGTLGTNRITAAAGSGTSGQSRNGGAGSVGRIHLDYSGSYTGTTSPTLDSTLDPTIKAGGADFFAFF